MKIGKENIESFIFDYHEGNLSDSEKAEVLNYIHIHPEYEVEFTQWAQSYLPFENTIENYGLTNNLLKTPPIHWYNKTWLKITAPIILAALVSIFYFTLPEQTVLSHTQQTKQTEEHSIAKEQIQTKSKLKTNTLKYTKKISPNINTTTNIVQNNTAQNQLTNTNNAIETIQVVNTTPTVTDKASDIQEKKVITSDSVTNITNRGDSNNKKETDKKRKNYKIKAATDFIPSNPDF